jgi:type IV secretion system protein VirD4
MNTPNIKMAGRKKITPVDLLIYAMFIFGILYFISSLGATLDLTVGADGKPSLKLLGQSFQSTLKNPSLVFSYVFKGGFCTKFAGMTAIFIGIYVLYKLTISPKKLHQKGTEHGSAHWGSKKEIKLLADKDEKNKNPQPQLKAMRNEDGKPIFDKKGEVLCAKIDNNIVLSKEVELSLNAYLHKKNLNVLVVGGSGSGKTRFYGKPNIMQLNTSYVITDPKGEILQSTGKMLIEAGYELKVLNLIEMEHSNNYNPFAYVYDYDGQLSEAKVMQMIGVLMKNTKGEGEKDDFWSLSAEKLLSAIVFLLFEESEYKAKFTDDGKIIPETRDFSHLNFYSVGEKLRKISYPSDPKDINFKSELDIDFDELDSRKENTLASRYYKEFRIAPAETGQSIVSTANARTQTFNLKVIADLTCTDNIHLETIGDKKTALFVIISPIVSTFNFLSAMMYTQMFDTLSNRANYKYADNDKMLPVHVRCIMDEFANIGQIPEFEKVIAFVRSMGMSLNVIIQNLAQLKARYEKTWEVITGNCDTVIFLGGKEESTLKYVSESLGKETIDIETKNRTKGDKSYSTSESNSIIGRELMTASELSTMSIGNCIVMMRAENPFYCTKFPIEKHKNFKFTEDFDKNNAYYVSEIKVVTLEEFIRNNEEKSAEIPPENTVSEKLQLLISHKPEVVTQVIIPDFMPEDYDEAELLLEIAENSRNIIEIIDNISENWAEKSDITTSYYGVISAPQTINLGEPLANYISLNERTENNEKISDNVSLTSSEEENIENYGEEIPEIPDVISEISENFADTAMENYKEFPAISLLYDENFEGDFDF